MAPRMNNGALETDLRLKYSHEQKYIFIACALIAATACFGYAIYFYTAGHTLLDGITVFTALTGIILLGTVIPALLWDAYRYSAYFIQFLMAGMLLGSSYLSGGLLYTSPYWLTVLPILSGLMLGKGGVFLGAALALTDVIILSALYLNGVHVDRYSTHEAEIIEMAVRVGVGSILVVSVLIFVSHRAMDRVSEMARKKNIEYHNMLRMIGHDILGVLTVISGNSQLLNMRADELPESIKVDLETIADAREDIQKLTSRIRDLESIESGKSEIELSPVNVTRAVYSATELLQSDIERKRINIVFQLDVAPELCVMADEESLCTVVLQNLLSNAVRYSYPESSVIIKVASKNGKVRTSITDQGVGIPDGLIKGVMSAEKKSIRKDTENVRKVGIGLITAQSYVKHFGGELVFTSKSVDDSPDSHGSTFDLTLRAAL